MKAFAQRLFFLASKPVALYVLCGVILYLLMYVNSPFLSGATSPDGWWGWWDQKMYLNSAAAFSKLEFDPKLHWYPPGYPLAGSLFYDTFPRHPFLPVNVLSFALLIWALNAIFRHYVSPVTSMVLVACLFLNDHLLRNLIFPWNSIPCHALTCLTAYVLLFRRRGVSDYVVAGVAAGVVFICRPASLAPFLVLLAGRALFDRRLAVRGLAVAAAVSTPFVIAFFVWNHAIYGSLLSPYMRNEAVVGYSPGKLMAKLYFLLIDPSTVYASNRSILSEFPWLLVALPGIAHGFKTARIETTGLVGATILTFCVYLGYNNFNPLGMFAYHSVHYILWTFPIFALFSFLTLWKAWASLRPSLYVGLLALPFVVIASLHPHLSLIAEGSNVEFHSLLPIDVVELKAASGQAPPALKVDGRPAQPHYSYYDLITVPTGIRCYLHCPAHTILETATPANTAVSFWRLGWELRPRSEALVKFFSRVLWLPWKQQNVV